MASWGLGWNPRYKSIPIQTLLVEKCGAQAVAVAKALCQPSEFLQKCASGREGSAAFSKGGDIPGRRHDGGDCGIIRGMSIRQSDNIVHDRAAFAPFIVSQDGELAVKAMRGIADIEAGRCAPVAEVRERLLSRYEQTRACV